MTVVTVASGQGDSTRAETGKSRDWWRGFMCRVEGCTNDVRSRGLCLKHYRQANRLMHAEPDAFAALEEAGVILPAKRKNDLRDTGRALLSKSKRRSKTPR